MGSLDFCGERLLEGVFSQRLVENQHVAVN